ncbi:LpqB family beta-propeller domain-containing protein [Streptosporangium sp. NPDC049376]|uniref:LpqB family beta-propeller domain-containing protein n=1 Tax=Streptosporangium sp. NPDC049376 TaxID=3366192 RepID=UPI0037BBA3B8
MPTRTLRARAGVTALVATLACGLASCSVIPVGMHSTVGENGHKGNPLGDPYARVIAVAPSADWSAADVVNGFKAAMASVDDPGREVARKYLTDSFARTWNPQSGVTVYRQSEPPVVQVGEGEKDTRVTLKGTVTALIDQDGRYRPSGGPLNEPFVLVKGAGGWRIDSAPPGLLLSEADAERAYLKVDLYFLDAEEKGLVIDQVRVPIDPASNFAKTTVERLLRGPSSSLKGAVRSAFDGTRLIDVTTEDNRVVVDLTNRVAPDLVGPMTAQLAGTLAALTKGGWGFEVRVRGEPYYTDNPLTVDAQEQTRFDPWMAPGEIYPYYVADDALWLLGKDNTGQPVLGKAGEKDGTRTDMAISAHAQVAALSHNGTALSVAPLATGGEWRQWATGRSLAPPCWDRYQTLWTVERPDDHTSRVIRIRDGQRYAVSAPDLDSVHVSLLKVARDGVHVAVVVRDGTGEQVKVGTVIGRGGATRITNLQVVVPVEDKQKIRDIAWKDGKTLYVLTDKSDLLEVSLTGESKSLPSNTGIQNITALDGSLLAGAVDDDGKRQILYWTSSKWEPRVKNENGRTDFAEQGPAFPAYPLD